MPAFSAGASFPEVLYRQPYYANGTWTCPTSGIYQVELLGGGGGGSGGPADTVTGAGGAGATLYVHERYFGAGNQLTIVVGAAGAGGNAGAAGSAGGATIVSSATTVYWYAPGGRGATYHATVPDTTGANTFVLANWLDLTNGIVDDARRIPGGFGAKGTNSGPGHQGGAVGQYSTAFDTVGYGYGGAVVGAGSSGGDSFYGKGGSGVNGSAGASATGFGAGGGGGYFATAGGSGSGGLVIITLIREGTSRP